MSDARSKIDILYQDVLGEINDVVNRVDELKTGIPESVDLATARLKVQADEMLALVGKLGNLNKIVPQFESVAKRIILFAKEERDGIESSQRALQTETTKMFIQYLKKDSDSHKVKLWVIITLLGTNCALMILLAFILVSPK